MFFTKPPVAIAEARISPGGNYDSGEESTGNHTTAPAQRNSFNLGSLDSS